MMFQLTSPPVLKLWDTQGYLWLPYDLMEVIKLIRVTFKQKFFFQKNILCHSFRITVIPFLIIVIPSGLLSFKMATRGGHICEFFVSGL